MLTIATTYPRPLIIAHRIEREALVMTACGSIAGQRRFDRDRGTFVQDTAHYTLTAEQPAGLVACADCLALGVAA